MQVRCRTEGNVLPFPGGARSREAIGARDEELIVARAVRAAQQGDRDAVRYLYVRYAEDVHRCVNHILRDHHEAEDVTQQVFAKLMTTIDRYEQRAMPFRAWLFRVARNVALDDLRARRCIPTDDAELVSSAFSPAPMSTLREALRVLPADQRNVVYLRHVLGLSPPEIAARLHKSESAVHGLHHRGRRALRLELDRLRAAPSIMRRAKATPRRPSVNAVVS